MQGYGVGSAMHFKSLFTASCLFGQERLSQDPELVK